MMFPANYKGLVMPCTCKHKLFPRHLYLFVRPFNSVCDTALAPPVTVRHDIVTGTPSSRRAGHTNHHTRFNQVEEERIIEIPF